MATHDAISTRKSVERKTLAGFIAAGAVLLMVLGTAWLAAATFVSAVRQVRTSIETIAALERLRAAVSNLTASEYGWLATHDASFMDERNAALAASRQELETLGLRIPGDQTQARRNLETIATVLDRAGAAELRAPVVDATLTRTASAEIQRNLGELIAAHRQIYSDDLASARTALRSLYGAVALAAVVMLLALAWLLLRIRLDLRDRAQVERNLQESNQLLESLLESIPAMIFAKDARDLKFVRINRTGERLLGVRREELIGKDDRDFFPPAQADHFIAKDRQTLESGDLVVIKEEQINTRHGQRTLHTFKVPVPGASGQPMLLLGISLDITEQKEAERRIVALNEELTRQAQLLQSSNQELESFSYSVSHDLRAPLRAINGYARLLQQDYGPRFDAEGARYLRTICNACDRMAQLIDDLLEFSRIGRQTLEFEPIDMEAIVDRVINDAIEGRETPPPTIETRSLPSVCGDRNMMHLVWQNLIDNAVKYTTGVEKPRIRIEAEETSDEIIYSVSDNGIGFDMQYSDKLFGVFQRLHSDVRFPGTGVGLAIAHRIVARHGGRIWAVSEPGRGSKFSFAMSTDQRVTACESLAEAT